jgi:hypothetical protein
MHLRRRKSRRARAVDAVRESAPGKLAEGAGAVGLAAGRSGQAMAGYGRRKATGKRAPLLVSAPALAGASIATFFAVRKLRRGMT